MTTSIKDLNPQIIWKNFYLLTQVPRPSGHLERVQQFLLDWAKEHGIEAFKDGAENIVMRKPATPGRENAKTAVLQAHMDMVPQKVDESTHNFEADPIETYIDGDWVKAKGTTLGSDDGMGVAAIMAVMESTDIKHGPLEALITADEETCMYGVNHLSADTLKGDILLNIDNETMGEFVIGSAGGVNINATMQYKEVALEEGDIAVKVSLKGLRGGHSGLEINEGRANANKLMARFVRQAIADDEARLCSWQGGNMRNAIPRTATVVMAVPLENYDDFCELAQYCQQVFNDEFRGVEEGITLSVETTAMPAGRVPEEIHEHPVGSGDEQQSGHCGHQRQRGEHPHPGPLEQRDDDGVHPGDAGELLRDGRHEGGVRRTVRRLATELRQSHRSQDGGGLSKGPGRRSSGAGVPCRTGVQHHRRRLSEDGPRELRSHVAQPAHPRRALQHSERCEVLAVPQGSS